MPITLQTFVVMLAGLMLPWRQAGAAVATYLAAGAVGLPVFASGTSTLALVGPSAGFLFGFLPGVVAIALLRGKSDTSSFAAAALRGRYLLAALVGGVVVVYAFGFVIQSALTGAPLSPPWPWPPWASWLATPSRPWWPLWPPPACPSSVADLSY